MNKGMKYFRTVAVMCVIGLFYSSCEKKANYPNIPIITFNNFYCDSACLRINFTDGNGDIGYPSQDAGAPPNFYAVVMPFIYKTQTYDSLITFSYNVPYITPSGNDKELNGIIQVNFEGLLNEWVTQDTAFSKIANLNKLEFKVWIYDRAGNKSNVLIIPPQNYPCQ
jgi:hypothetical protein